MFMLKICSKLQYLGGTLFINNKHVLEENLNE
jgi:hypothetical protein